MANIYNFADTWDNAAVAWVGVGIDITDSASDAASRLLKLSVNSVETFAVRKDGAVVTGSWQGTAIGPTKGGTGLTSFAAGDIIYASGVNTLAKLSAGTNGHVLTLSSGVPVWAAPGGGASAPLTLASGTITANAPALNITQTWNNAAVAFTGIKYNVTITADDFANSLLMDLQEGGSSKFSVNRFGTITAGGLISGTWFYMTSGRTAINSSNAYSITTGNANGAFDVSLIRQSSGVWGVRSGSTSSAAGAMHFSTFTVSGLPAAGTVGAGGLAFVSDANATTARTTVAGGGANFVMVMSNGTNWLIVA